MIRFSIDYSLLSIDHVREIAFALPEVVERDHVGKPSLRTNNKIFVTLWEQENRACLKLSLPDQAMYCTSNPEIFHPVHGGWGRMGFTFAELDLISKKKLKEALVSAWTNASIKKKGKK